MTLWRDGWRPAFQRRPFRKRALCGACSILASRFRTRHSRPGKPSSMSASMTASSITAAAVREEQEARTLQRVHPRPLFQQAVAFTYTASQSFRLINVKKS